MGQFPGDIVPAKIEHVCAYHVFIREDREGERSRMSLSLLSSAAHLFPETKTSLGAVSRKK